MMSIGLHCRLVGRPGRAAALKRFIDYVKGHDKVWLARRIDIARHWREHHPYAAAGAASLADGREPNSSSASAASSSIRLGSPSAPSRSSSGRRTTVPAACTMRSAAPSAPPARPSGSACSDAHPDLAGKLAAAKRLTAESTAEQASAGPRCADRRRARAVLRAQRRLCHRRFGFPFIIAVRGQDQGRDPRRLRDAHRQRPRHRVRHRLPPGRAHRAAAPQRPAAHLKEQTENGWPAPITRRMAASPPQTRAAHRPRRLHRGLRGHPQGRDAATSSPAPAVLGATRGCGSCRGRCRASPRPSRNTSWRSRPAAAATGRSPTPAPKACCSSSRAS